jgi:hypothetical protein
MPTNVEAEAAILGGILVISYLLFVTGWGLLITNNQ